MSASGNSAFGMGFEGDEAPGAPRGPISQHRHHCQYLEDNSVPQMFESLMACLMMEQPDDMYSYLDNKLETIKSIGPENINWETFVYPLHPSRDPVRQQLLKDRDEKEVELLTCTGYGLVEPNVEEEEEEEEEAVTATEGTEEGVPTCTGYGADRKIDEETEEGEEEVMVVAEEREEEEEDLQACMASDGEPEREEEREEEVTMVAEEKEEEVEEGSYQPSVFQLTEPTDD